MTDPADPVWALPPLLPFPGSDWPSYEERLYEVFRADFLVSPLEWRGLRVTVQREPLLNGKEDGFWHVVTETGPTKRRDDRIPNLDRCARIRWIKAVITAPASAVCTFGQSRNGHQHYGIAVPDFSFVVFLRQWPRTVQLMTAYYVGHEGKRADYRRQWEADTR